MENKYFYRDENLVTRSISSETILVPLRNNVGDLGSIYTLNEIGSLIWQMLDGETSLAQIHAAITHTYEVTETEAAADLSEFLAQLFSAGLVGEVAA